ncbi:MAG: DNA-3-methyladenine glycosylase 2 family protein [Saprospiraceae bacterium]|nr:DNA-3-methyladenine glycosylase 2 family protein [Saprospiraceae bacterium]
MDTNVRPEILTHLRRDKKLAVLIDNCPIAIHKEPIRVFDDLIRSIVSQQLSTTAAATIYGRFVQSLDSGKPIPPQIFAKSVEELRSYGLSYQKAGYIHNVAHHFSDNNLYDTDWHRRTDDEIIEELTKIKGVGKWTVEMILMFSLYREDVLPLDDLIIRNNMIALYGVTSVKKVLIAELTDIAENWRPYRTIACRYLWAAKDSKYLIGASTM